VRWRQVIGVWIVLAALAAEYWFVERRHEPVADGAAPHRPRLLSVRAGEVREVRLTRKGRTVVLRRGAAAWSVVEPVGAPIPPDLLGAFANALIDADEIARIGSASGGADAYGLDEGATTVEVTGERGERVAIVIGGTNPTGTAVYARRDGTAEVVLIGRNVRYYEDLIFQSLAAERTPAAEEGAPVG